MEEQHFSIAIDQRHFVIEARLNGLWNLSVLSRFERAIVESERVLAAQGSSTGRGNLLIDARNHGVQPRDVVEQLQNLSARLSNRMARTAVIVESSLHRLQANRISKSLSHRVFASEDDARPWLVSPQLAKSD